MTPDVVHLALTCADGTVAIMAFVTREYNPDGTVRWARVAEPATIEREIARTAAALDAWKVPIQRWRPIDPADVPADRTFRNALRDDGTRLQHDLPHARELHRAAIRVARAPKLADLDVAYQRADETNDTAAKKQIAAAKQLLRDLPAHPAIEAATTTEALKAFWPEAIA
jgi:hypothetical protein